LIASAVRSDSRRVWIVDTDTSVATAFTQGEHVGDRVTLCRSGELAV